MSGMHMLYIKAHFTKSNGADYQGSMAEQPRRGLPGLSTSSGTHLFLPLFLPLLLHLPSVVTTLIPGPPFPTFF